MSQVEGCKRPSLRIVSDGVGIGTHIYDTETGAEVRGVRSITWQIDYDGLAIATIEVICAMADIQAKEVEVQTVEPECLPQPDGRGAADVTGCGETVRRFEPCMPDDTSEEG